MQGIFHEIVWALLWTGLIAGGLRWFWAWRTGRREWDPLVWIGWSVSLGLLIGMLGLYAIAVFSGGYGLGWGIGSVVLACGFLGGLISGVATLKGSRGIRVGSVAFAGSLFVVGGAASQGYSPLNGTISWTTWLLLFLLSGPMSLITASIIAIRHRRLAGAWLLTGAFVSSMAAVQVMTPPPGTWSGGPGMGAYIFRWSMALILPFPLPMLLLGLLLLWMAGTWGHSNEKKSAGDPA
ncbi:hypothetical protein [Tautonia plasticadhaerens]|uniref:hypothetical protein n=1 Tax=Tautonia plasticadhaerens TaxID=2527974 RepID=UPI00119D562B|nr:hypothetical protein [Tautonia plasticadhaerens]